MEAPKPSVEETDPIEPDNDARSKPNSIVTIGGASGNRVASSSPTLRPTIQTDSQPTG